MRPHAHLPCHERHDPAEICSTAPRSSRGGQQKGRLDAAATTFRRITIAFCAAHLACIHELVSSACVCHGRPKETRSACRALGAQGLGTGRPQERVCAGSPAHPPPPTHPLFWNALALKAHSRHGQRELARHAHTHGTHALFLGAEPHMCMPRKQAHAMHARPQSLAANVEALLLAWLSCLPAR